mgnify:CR=1 FL=1
MTPPPLLPQPLLASELAALFARLPLLGDEILLLDLRSFLSYQKSHLYASLNVSVPPPLVKRAPLTIGTVSDSLCGADRLKFDLRSGRDIILFDTSSVDLTDSPLLASVARQLQSEGLVRSIRWLVGGFNNFAEQYPSRVVHGLKPATDAFGSPFLSDKANNCESSLNAPSSLPPPIPALPTSMPAFLLPPVFCPPSRILDDLYLADIRFAADLAGLRAANIHFIVNVTTECPNVFDSAVNSEFIYYRLALCDTPSQQCALTVLLDTFAFMDSALSSGRGSLLVHCAAGRSRSVTVVIAYLMFKFGMSVEGAYKYVSLKRPEICPNLGFMGLLVKLQPALHSNPSAPLAQATRLINTDDADIDADAAPAAPTAPAAPAASKASLVDTDASMMSLRPHLASAPLAGLRSRSSDAIPEASTWVRRRPHTGGIFKALSCPSAAAAAAAAAATTAVDPAAVPFRTGSSSSSPVSSSCATSPSRGGCVRSRSLSSSHLLMLNNHPLAVCSVDKSEKSH